jgi:hypothetical protein
MVTLPDHRHQTAATAWCIQVESNKGNTTANHCISGRRTTASKVTGSLDDGQAVQCAFAGARIHATTAKQLALSEPAQGVSSEVSSV